MSKVLNYYLRQIWTEGVPAEGSVTTSEGIGRCYFSPLQVPFRLTIDGIGFIHGNVAGGNLYGALYDSAADAPVNQVAVSDSTAVTGTNQKQLLALSDGDIQLDGGLYFTCLEPDNTSDNYMQAWTQVRSIGPANVNHGLTVHNQNLGSYQAPPVTATPAVGATYARYFMGFVRVISVP